MLTKRKHIPQDTFIAAAALYETLFNRRTIGKKDSNTVLIDTYKDTYMDERIIRRNRYGNIVCSMDVISLIGWKYHESQQQPMKRGSADFTLKDIVSDIKDDVDEQGKKFEVKFGTLVEEGDVVKEINKGKK